MNSIVKILVFSIVFLALFASVNATAAKGVLEAYDSIGAHHANAGEDFNVHIATSTVEHQTGDADRNISSDYNYAVFFRWDNIDYSAQSGTAEYWDLNAVDANYADSDENTLPGRITGGQCLTLHKRGVDSLDMNIIMFNQLRNDLNKFDVKITVPIDTNHNDMNGKAGVLELWRLTWGGDAGAIPYYTCSQVDANVAFVMGPAIVISPLAGPIDGNTTVFGYGFPTDANVRIKFKDVNGQITDLNFLDVNAGAYNSYSDVNGAGERDWNYQMYVIGATDANKMRVKGTQWMLNNQPDGGGPFYGYVLQPDSNGEFDVNIQIPFTISLAGPSGTIPDHNIFVDINSGTVAFRQDDGNLTADVIVTPGFTMSADENVTVGICTNDSNGSRRTCKAADSGESFQRVHVETAMRNGWIRNMEQVSGLEVILKSGDTLLAKIKLNSDVNMALGPRRDYSSEMTGSTGRAEIDSSAMPEFGTDPFGNPIDANITIYNIPSAGGRIPYIARNGILCPTSVCKTLDNGTFSFTSIQTATDGTKNWDLNNDNLALGYRTIDGNLSFRVSGFSAYSAGTLTAALTGDSLNGREYFTRDGNITISFTWSDTNYQDQNVEAWQGGVDANFSVAIYLSKTQCGQHYLVYQDFNILDMNGIKCTTATEDENGFLGGSYFSAGASYDRNYAINDTDANIATTQTCTIELDLAGYADNGDATFTHWTGATGSTITGSTNRRQFLFPDLRTSIMGAFYIDVNVTAPRDTAVGNTVCATSDANTIINKPEVLITDTNFNNSYGPTFLDFNAQGLGGDGNLWVDFNLSLQDTNLSLGDINLSIYYSQIQNDRNNAIAYATDLNLFFADRNSMAGWHATADSDFPVECTTYLTQDTLDVNFSHTRDANCRFNWNLGEDVREGRYFIDMIITPGTPDHNRGAGAWAFDTNWDFVTMAAKTSTLLYDANSSRNPGAINDTNNPILVVSGSSSSTSQCVTISLDANDSSNISKYWQTITTDSVGQYTDQNVTASYQACVGSSTQLPVTYTYYFKATDFGDRNSSVQSHSITFNSAGGGPASTTTDTGTGDTGGTGGTGGTGSTGGETTPGTETVLEKTVTGTATAEEIAGILAEAGYSEAQIAKMTQTAGNANITQAIKVEKITSSTGAISYKTTVTMTVKNKTGNDWENITVVVEVPKAIATDASEISSTYTMNVLKADPIIEFVVPEVKAGQSADITYSVGKEVGDSAAAEMSAPILTGYTEKAEPEPGPAPTPTPTPTPAPTPEAAGIDLTTIGILVVILVVIVAVYMGVVRKPKKKGLAAVKK